MRTKQHKYNVSSKNVEESDSNSDIDSTTLEANLSNPNTRQEEVKQIITQLMNAPKPTGLDTDLRRYLRTSFTAMILFGIVSIVFLIMWINSIVNDGFLISTISIKITFGLWIICTIYTFGASVVYLLKYKEKGLAITGIITSLASIPLILIFWAAITIVTYV